MNVNVSQADMQGLVNRLMRLARLDTTVFDEVRLDPAATIPSVIVAVAATFLAGLGGWLWWSMQDFGDKGKVLMQSMVLGSLFSIALWVAWVLIVYVLLTQVFRAQADVQQLVRVMGLAAAPLALSVLMFIPAADFGIGLASIALFFGLSTIAVQAATNASAGTVLVCNAAGFAVWAIVLGFLVTDSSYFAPGLFLMDAANEALASLSNIKINIGG
ncbi:MAG TPA: hypothetical protein VM013_02735 [Dehalococcoidia bacterium]|nr:hypothetical protein [Dehalococcoidia bacterium]